MTDTKISSNVPSAARKAVKEANRLIAEQNTPRRADWVPGQPEGNSQPAAEPSAAAQPVVATPAEDPVKVIEHKYNVLAGKYNAETQRLLGRVDVLAAENAQLLARMAQQPQPQFQPQARAEDKFSVVTAKEREEYGEELVTLMEKIAKANAPAGSAELARLTNELNQMKGQVQQTQQIGAETRMEKVWQALDNTVPNWRVINDSQQFLDWLENVDIMSGQARMNGLRQAFSVGDSTRVVGIFKRFLEEDSSSRSTPQVPATAQVDQGTLVAPTSGRSGSQEAPNGTSGRIFSEQEIDDFYSRVQRKRIDPDEAKAFERELQIAVREGRVVPRRDDRHLANSR